jgi:hypothetical protein
MSTDALREAPLCDNPSGMYCPACRAVGLSHCSDPEHCGEMRPMRHGERLAAPASETEKLPTKWRSEEWCASTMTDDRPAEEICASELEAALKADRQGSR